MRRSSQASNSHHRRRSDHIVITRHKRRLEKLFREERYSSATRVLEQPHKSLKDPTVTAAAAPSSLEQTREILLGLNPQATVADDLPSVEDDPAKPGEPFLFDQAFVQRCVRDLPKGSANVASAWSYNIIHRLYAAPSEGAEFHLTTLATFLSKMANGMLGNRLRTKSRAVLIPKPEAGKFRPIGIGEAWYRLLGRCILKEVGREVGGQLSRFKWVVESLGGVRSLQEWLKYFWMPIRNTYLSKLTSRMLSTLLSGT